MEDLFFLGIKAVIRNNIGQILLLLDNPDNLVGNRKTPKWDLPGGRVLLNEKPAHALKREVFEETGLDIEIIDSFAMVLSNIRIPQKKGGDYGLILSIYNCNCSDVKNIKLSKEHINYAFYDSNDAAKLLEFKYPKEFTSVLR